VVGRVRRAVAARVPPGPGVLVLGMHRSGTSAMTRLINLMGPATCSADDMVRGPWNPTGHWESRTLMHFDDGLLAQMGCTWWAPPPSGPAYAEWSANITTGPRAGRRVFAQVHTGRPWVWKDPRACLLLPYWRQALDRRSVAVVCVRNPLEVASSLEKRHGLAPSFGLALWERYNRLLVAHVGNMAVIVTRYDDLVSDAEAWTGRTRAFLEAAGFTLRPPATADGAGEFVDPDMRHSSRSDDDVAKLAPSSVASLFATMTELAGATSCFVPPDIEPEDPAVAEELATLGPLHPPAFRTPPTGSPSPGAAVPGADG